MKAEWSNRGQRVARVSTRALSFELSAIKQIELAAARDPEVVSLAQGIPFLPMPQPIKDFVEEKIVAGKCDQYSLTPGLPELREELSRSLANEGSEYDPEDEIIVTAGSIEGMTATLLSFIDIGDEVLVPSPTYTSYIGCIQLAGGIPRYFSLDEDRGFDFSAEAFEAAITPKTRAVVFCTPNNPTGTVYSQKQTERVMEIAAERNLLVVVDEAYKDYYFSGASHFSPSLLSWARNRIVRVCSFSKAYAMTGWRVGFVAAPRELASTILRVHDLMVTCAPVASQYAALGALKYGEEALKHYVSIFERHRDLTVQHLDRMSEWLDYQVPQATYFAFPRIKDSVANAHHSELFVSELFKKGKVALVPGRAFGPSGESHVRINFGRSEEDLVTGLNRLAEFLSSNLVSGRKFSVLPQASTEHSNTEHSASNTPAPTSISMKERILTWLAQHTLRGQDVCTIGIIGVRGKTVAKRIVTRALEESGPTSASILSYNSISGLCLSILELPSPRTFTEKISFLCKALLKAFLAKPSRRFLVLEYGLTNESEIDRYLSIVKPKCLLVTGTVGYEDGTDSSKNLTALFKRFIKQAAPELLLLPNDEPWLTEQLEPLVPTTVVASPLLEDAPISTPSLPILSSRSEQYAYVYAVHTAQHLGLSDSQLESFLHAHTKS